MNDFPFVVEEAERILVIYSKEPVVYKEEDDGVEIFYSKKWRSCKDNNKKG
ncbi:MAG: hypothetical protein WKI49_00545 [Aquificaceae bacterium]